MTRPELSPAHRKWAPIILANVTTERTTPVRPAPKKLTIAQRINARMGRAAWTELVAMNVSVRKTFQAYSLLRIRGHTVMS